MSSQGPGENASEAGHFAEGFGFSLRASETTLRSSPDFKRVRSCSPAFTSPAARRILPSSARVVME